LRFLLVIGFHDDHEKFVEFINAYGNGKFGFVGE
jgi:hypothetical protein